MRKLYLLQGVPSSGKSTFIKENKLENYTLSSDDFRLKLGSLTYSTTGDLEIGQKESRKAWDLLFQVLEERMTKGCLSIVDATHSTSKSLKKYKELAKKYYYEIVLVEFDIDLEDAIKRDSEREDYKKVGSECIKKHFGNLKGNNFQEFKTIKPKEVKSSLSFEMKDYSHYEKIIFIGDLQGCNQSLQEYFKDNPMNDNYLYIFVGDYLDRGIENKEVLEFALNNQRDNFIFLRGNHEFHLEKWSRDEESFSKLFEEKTKPQIEDVDKDKVSCFCENLRDFEIFKYKGKEILVSHGGLGHFPKDINFMRSIDFNKGIGNYNTDIDQLFNENTKENQYQIHGHRNINNLKISNGRSFNLEGKVEYGQFLRILELDDNFKEVYIKQNIYDQNLKIKNFKRSFLDRLRSCEYIKEKDLGNHISSFNFTRKAFRKGYWNDVNIKARGLFLNVENKSIVARSYDKFFNLNERDETKLENLKDNLVFPIEVYQKENGFLGILSVVNNELFVCSKSTNTGDFAGYFRDIIENQLDVEETKKILKGGFSMVFEVNDPINDPHMIKYKEAHLVLLDVIKNQEELKLMPYSSVRGIAKKIGCQYKILTKKLESWEEFKKWELGTRDSKEKLEGYVIKDSKDFMFKIKLPFYSFWKYMRTVKDRVRNDKEINFSNLNKEGKDFIIWCKNQDKELLDKDIITLREKYWETEDE